MLVYIVYKFDLISDLCILSYFDCFPVMKHCISEEASM